MDEAESSVDGELFAREMKEALENITRLGKAHQVEFVQKLSDTFCELNGGPPSAEQVSGIFGGIKQQLAEEAKNEFLEQQELEQSDVEDKDDEDYAPNDADLQQAAEDAALDDEESDDEEEDAVVEVVVAPVKKTTSKSKILVTPVKKSKSGSRVDIYLKEHSEDNQSQALQ